MLPPALHVDFYKFSRTYGYIVAHGGVNLRLPYD